MGTTLCCVAQFNDYKLRLILNSYNYNLLISDVVHNCVVGPAGRQIYINRNSQYSTHAVIRNINVQYSQVTK